MYDDLLGLVVKFEEIEYVIDHTSIECLISNKKEISIKRIIDSNRIDVPRAVLLERVQFAIDKIILS